MDLWNTKNADTGIDYVVENVTIGGNKAIASLYWINQTGTAITFNISYTAWRTAYNYTDYDQIYICVYDDLTSTYNQYHGQVLAVDMTTKEQTKSGSITVTVPAGSYLSLFNNHHATSTWTVTYK